MKLKKSELAKLRQEMANKIAELQQTRDADLEELEAKLNQKMADTTETNKSLVSSLRQMFLQLKAIKTEHRYKLLPQIISAAPISQNYVVMDCQDNMKILLQCLGLLTERYLVCMVKFLRLWIRSELELRLN